jgi:putative ABC transport system permease protein
MVGRIQVSSTSDKSKQILVFRQGFSTTAIGLVIGLGATLVLMRVLRGMLAGLESERLGGMLIAVGLVVLTGVIACWVLARRAARIDPMAALRHN